MSDMAVAATELISKFAVVAGVKSIQPMAAQKLKNAPANRVKEIVGFIKEITPIVMLTMM